MRIAIYTRLSPNPDKDDTKSQIEELTKFISLHKDWSLVSRYEDLQVSGGKKGSDRPQFKLMMEDARKKKFDLLLFWSLDRLSREGATETMGYLNQLTSYGVDYKSYTEQYFDSCGIFKEAVIAIMATVAKQERVRLIERTKAGLAIARAKGVVLGRKRKVVDILIAKEMREKGISCRKIGEKFGVSEATVWRLLGGKQAKPELEPLRASELNL